MTLNGFEKDKDYFADYIAKILKEYPTIISNSLRKKTDMPISITDNEIFICVKLLDRFEFNLSTYNKGVISPCGLNFETSHSFAKIKEGFGEFSGWFDYPGISEKSIQIAVDFAEKRAREALSEFIGEKGEVKGIVLKNDDYKFDVSLNNEFKTKYDIRNADMSELIKESVNLCNIIKDKSKGKIKRVYVDIRSELNLMLLGNSAGGLVFQKIPRTILYFITEAYPHGIIDPSSIFFGKKGFSYGGVIGLDIFHDLLDSKYFDIDNMLNDIVEESIDFLYNSIPIEKTGFKTYKPIKAVLSPQAAGIFVHETLGHHVEQDLEDISYGARFLRDYIGEQVSSKHLSISFNPMYNKNQLYRPYGSYFYDDECTKAMDTPIIKDGIAIDTLTDLTYAKTYNVKPNAHSLKDYIRMSNLIIDDKKGVNPEEIFEEIKGEGYYIKSIRSGYTSEITKTSRVDIGSLYFIDKNMELMPIATLASPSSKKRKGLAMINYNLSIDSFDILHKTKRIGKNIPIFGQKSFIPLLNAGHCGKESELTATSEGGAYLLLEDLLLTKNESDAPRKNLFLN